MGRGAEAGPAGAHPFSGTPARTTHPAHPAEDGGLVAGGLEPSEVPREEYSPRHKSDTPKTRIRTSRARRAASTNLSLVKGERWYPDGVFGGNEGTLRGASAGTGHQKMPTTNDRISLVNDTEDVTAVKAPPPGLIRESKLAPAVKPQPLGAADDDGAPTPPPVVAPAKPAPICEAGRRGGRARSRRWPRNRLCPRARPARCRRSRSTPRRRPPTP